MPEKITSHRQLEVYKKAFALAMRIFELTKSFPREEAYSLTAQIRKASRSVCANATEAWRRRRYEAAFISKLNEAETEAAETQCWLEFSVKCGYLDRDEGKDLFNEHDEAIATLVGMQNHPETWVFPSGRKQPAQ